ncbi:hypothetical protein Dred_0517 [Desulforamulus reducens MI-1]|uniref:HD domain-containing protein n=1 Tax=Desulforamulus reducens (strain ATCC BAA-1160 / DSM 100696 / MI-1) TaxID=349161 RepID=A4J1V9_DESRM|nr:hypothetical protein [Desulforamulus reducens]ABO49062.1 hypothetical protein Dred_0517 [Desulforamulus reducens MI-1]
MLIHDKILIENIINNIDILEFLHNDTKERLETINEKLAEQIKSNQKAQEEASFTGKNVVDMIVPVWGYMLQDSINFLKYSDYREFSHWRPRNRSNVRDMINEIAFGIEKLCKYFIQFTEFEAVLYGIDANYRDHVVHVFRVWLLGMLFLLEKKPTDCGADGITFNIRQLEIDSPVKVKGVSAYNDNEILSMWVIIALCHDLGYPLEKTEKINEAVEKMFNLLGKLSVQKFAVSFQQEHQHINKFLLEFISSKIVLRGNASEDKRYKQLLEILSNTEKFTQMTEDKFKEDEGLNLKCFGTSIQSKYYLKFSKSLENYSHGIISCSIILKSLFYFLESDFNIQDKNYFSFEDARQFLIRREILRAIASHTCPEIYHLRTNTLSFLLILCDEMQEWGRPRFGEMKTGFVNTGIEKIEIKSYSSEKIEFAIKYVGTGNFENFAIRQFTRWHEILRSAVDDSIRNFKVEITFDFNGEKYKFNHEMGGFVVTKGLELYNLDEILTPKSLKK